MAFTSDDHNGMQSAFSFCLSDDNVACQEVPVLGINDYENNISIYPNPNTGNFQVSIENLNVSNNLNWNILDISGKLILNGDAINLNANGNSQSIEINNLEKGIYLFEIMDIDKSRSHVSKLVIY